MKTQIKAKLTTALLAVFIGFCVGAICNSDQPNKQSDTKGIELIGTLDIQGNLKDKSGLTEKFNNPIGLSSTSNDMFGGISAIAYSGKEDIFLLLADRGPDDGAVDWTCRFQEVRLKLGHNSTQPFSYELLRTIILKDQNGIGMTGIASAFPEFVPSECDSSGKCHSQSECESVVSAIPDSESANTTRTGTETSPRSFEPKTEARLRFDPEGIRIAKDGNIWITDEYGPRIVEFTPSGKFLRELTPPKHFLISQPGLSKADENPKNESGRQCNRGMEGLAMSSDSKTIFGLMQSPLLQDSFRQTKTDRPTGLNCRLLTLSLDSNSSSEMVYQLDNVANKLNEILRVDDNSFIAIERDGESGTAAKFKKLMLISTKNASRISGKTKLPADSLPAEIVPVKKKVLIDFLDPNWNLAGDKMPEKIEGLAFGPNLADGRKTLFVASDNDFDAANPTSIWVFALPKSLKMMP